MIDALDDAHIDVLLTTKHLGRLGCHADGRTYVVPVTFVYENGRVYGHTNEGMKVEMLRKNPQVCLEVDDIQDMRHWRSVIAWGTFEELQGEDAAKAFDLLFTRLGPERTSETSGTWTGDAMDHVSQRIRLRAQKGVVYSIRLTEKSGRFERP